MLQFIAVKFPILLTFVLFELIKRIPRGLAESLKTKSFQKIKQQIVFHRYLEALT